MDQLTQIRSKVERAKHHINDFRLAIREFNEIGPYEISAKENHESRQRTLYLSGIKEIPPDIPLIA